MVSSYEKFTSEKQRLTRSWYRSTPDVTPHVTSFLKCWTQQRIELQTRDTCPDPCLCCPYDQVKTEHLALCKEKRWSHAINCTWGRILFIYGLGESTAPLVLEWLILRLGGTLFGPTFSVFKGSWGLWSHVLHLLCILCMSSWLRQCPTSRKFAGSIPDCVIWIFHWHNPSDRNMALGLTQPLTEMSSRNIFLDVKAAGV